VPTDARQRGCKDLAEQLAGSAATVALGGGRESFLPAATQDAEGANGIRQDGADLTTGWSYIWNRQQLADHDPGDGARLLGLFASQEMFAEDDSAGRNPTLAEMTRAALARLSRNDEGYVVLIEHEGTDEFQHLGLIRRALDSARELNDAVKTALEMVDLDDTLVIVTADHGQGIVFSGYAVKGNPILGLATTPEGPHLGLDKKPYTTLGFHAAPQAHPGQPRADLSKVDTTAYDFVPQSIFPSWSVPHSGDDVSLYAVGPRSHLFGGVLDQSDLYYLLLHALGLQESASR
jgi:alkaline phosphatase